jgi:hypothetical protein
VSAEWTRFCEGARDLRVEGDRVEIQFAEGRRHQLTVEDAGDAYRVVGLVAKAGVTSAVPDLALHVWRRNRATTLAGFRIEPRGRLLGESLIPKLGLSAGEFQHWVRVVAAECDRFEHALTGKDVV